MSGQILIIDPIAINRIVLRSRVAVSCHSVVQAAAPGEALAAMRRHRPDLVLLGPGMGEDRACDTARDLLTSPDLTGVPVLILTRDFSPAILRAALVAGAEDALDPDMQGAFLLARIRRLLRRKSSLEDLAGPEIGLAEPAAAFLHPGRIAVVTARPSKARAWQAALRPLVGHDIACLDSQSALTLPETDVLPDLFVVEDNPDQPDDSLRFLAELRSRRGSRRSAVILVSDGQTRQRQDAENRMAMALDIGADDLLRHGFDAGELALRIERHLARKREDDRLRDRVENGLREAIRDPLTGAFNRRYTMPFLDQVAGRAVANRRSFALMMIDLDRFKTVNDTYGHAAGDRVLVEVAARLSETLRGEDLLCRFGGEEFLVVMPDAEFAEVRLQAGRLRRAIADRPVVLSPGQPPLPVTVSIGIAMADLPLLAADIRGRGITAGIARMIEQADRALYSAKAQGRNKVTVGRAA